MTYEEWIIQCAEEKCDKLYKWELICGSAALIIMMIYLIFQNMNLIIYAAICLALCGIEEPAMLIINRRAIKHVNRRLRRLNISLNILLKRFPKDKLRIETIRFKRDYGFLEKNQK